MAMPVPPGRVAQNRAIHATPPSMPMVRPAPMAPAANRYLGRYPAQPPMMPPGGAPMPGMAAGGDVAPAQYYGQGGQAGEADVSAPTGPVLPNTPSMQQPQGVGYAMGGNVLSAADRRALPTSDFAVPSKAPGSGSYPMPDKKHAAVAKGYAKRFGSPAVQSAVAAKAKAKFGMSKGGPVGTDEQTDSPGPEPVRKSKPIGGRAGRVAKFEKENGDREV